MLPGPSVEAVLLDMLLKGTMSLDYARDLFRQRDLFHQGADEFTAAYPGKFLAMVGETLLVGDAYFPLVSRLRDEFPGRPFYLHKP